MSRFMSSWQNHPAHVFLIVSPKQSVLSGLSVSQYPPGFVVQASSSCAYHEPYRPVISARSKVQEQPRQDPASKIKHKVNFYSLVKYAKPNGNPCVLLASVVVELAVDRVVVKADPELFLEDSGHWSGARCRPVQWSCLVAPHQVSARMNDVFCNCSYTSNIKQVFRLIFSSFNWLLRPPLVKLEYKRLHPLQHQACAHTAEAGATAGLLVRNVNYRSS